MRDFSFPCHMQQGKEVFYLLKTENHRCLADGFCIALICVSTARPTWVRSDKPVRQDPAGGEAINLSGMTYLRKISITGTITSGLTMGSFR
jgi:hypothetical protein